MKAKILSTVMLLMAAILSQAQNNSVNASQLPNEARTFISMYFKPATITKVERDTDDNRIKFEVNLSNGTEIEFRQDGSWKEVDGRQNAIPTDFINKNIVSYITQKYPDVKLNKIEKESAGYEVELTNGVELYFSADGKFLKLDD